MPRIKFQVPEPSSSGKDFKCILFSNPRPTASGPFWTRGGGAPFEQTW